MELIIQTCKYCGVEVALAAETKVPCVCEPCAKKLTEEG